ncbi:protein indeterminate-domain 4, chloroplastic-like [Curcuma longa]|uniref:protein indeterminate-domain 4, chloroplastic-like n=1 Tax=Curcuma longa TaxID=136217 RepID=UPI003D9F17B9
MASSSSTPLFRVEEEDECSHDQPASSSAAIAPQKKKKKKRNLPGKPDPGAEVIALSPESLLATNRFVCEVCSKGFQREQNLQLHRRGHNLPWRLKRKNPNEARRRQVYLCPEPTCVHHHPSRALGDLTGVKKHYSRKHGEKKWKCDKCSKRYAVRSDCRAHSKICGTRDYRCDCGTLFSRRDSFIAHRAFCHALAQENAGLPAQGLNVAGHGGQLYANRTLNLGLHPQLNPPPSGASQFDHLNMATTSFRPPLPPSQPSPPFFFGSSFYNNNQQALGDEELLQSKPFHGIFQLQDLQPSASNAGSSAGAANLFDLGFFSDDAGRIENFNHVSSFYNPFLQGELGQSMASQMPAALLLQKAAGIGVTPTGSFRSTSELAGRESASSRNQLEQEKQFQGVINELTNANDSSGIVFSNGVTRGFLGVGSVMRSMPAVGGVHLGVENISSVDSETKARSFAGGRIQ